MVHTTSKYIIDNSDNSANTTVFMSLKNNMIYRYKYCILYYN